MCPFLKQMNADNTVKNISLYIAISLIVFIELYILPIVMSHEMFWPLITGIFQIDAHILVFNILLLGLLFWRTHPVYREKIHMGFLSAHFVFCGIFFIFLFHLAQIFPFEPLPETHLLVKLGDTFGIDVTALRIRYRITYITLFAGCHYCIFSSVFQMKNTLKRYIATVVSTIIIIKLFWEWVAYELLKEPIKESLWKVLSYGVAKSNLFLLHIFGFETVSNFTGERGPVIGTDSFAAGIFAPCSGLEGIFLFILIFAVFLVLNWRNINKKRIAFVALAGCFLMYAANIFRIFALLLVGHFIDPELARGMFHSYAGIAIYATIIPIIFLASYNWLFSDKSLSFKKSLRSDKNEHH